VWELHPNARAALIYFGGNAEEVSQNLADYDSAFPERAIYLANYRSYGGSSGQPSEAILISDAQALYDLVAEHHGPIAVMGRSLGSGVATALAATRAVERVVLVTPYDSLANVAADHFSWFPVRWLLKDRFDSRRRIADVHVPVLIIIAERDEVIRRARSEALAAAVPGGPRHTALIVGATHNDITWYPAYMAALKSFLALP